MSTTDDPMELIAPAYRAIAVIVLAASAVVWLATGGWVPVLALWLWVCRAPMQSRREV